MADAQPLDDATLEELERVAAAMTEGPWQHELLGPGKLRYRITNPKGDAELGNWLVGEVRWGVNATGIALLRNHASALLHSSREAARLREALTEAEALIARNVYPTPDKPNSDWAVLQRVRAALSPSSPPEK
jgi:hypothetical protein